MNTHLTAITVSVLAGVAHADLTSFDSRGAFDLAAGALLIETFESSAAGPLAMPGSFDSGLNVNRFNGSTTASIESGDPQGLGFLNTTLAGANYLRFGHAPGGQPQTGSYSIDFSFGHDVTAFGFDISGFHAFAGAGGLNLTLFSNGQAVAAEFIAVNNPDVHDGFLGFINDIAFDVARINIPVIGPSGQADYTAYDDVVWSVPTPGTAALLGLAALAGARRRRV